MTVIPQVLSANGFDVTVSKVAFNGVPEIDSSLATADGTRFDLQTHKPKKFYIECTTPAGKASTAWKFSDR